ncbi:MAG: hypothetical protein F6J97_26790 [Leptolyngbya sp. SIO4C1]|nr:hypothetical protein [Leptolyngbya sp. SIO4C1]
MIASSLKPAFRPTFIFIEVFGCEGGIQSYIQDVLSAYGELASVPTDVFLLRDSLANLSKPWMQGPFRFHCFKSERPMLSRVRLTLALANHLILNRPSHVFCG